MLDGFELAVGLPATRGGQLGAEEEKEGGDGEKGGKLGHFVVVLLVYEGMQIDFLQRMNETEIQECMYL